MSRLDSFNRARVVKLVIEDCLSLAYASSDTRQAIWTNEGAMISPSPSESHGWAPLITFLRELHALTLLVYESRFRFPQSLFATLQRHLPNTANCL